METLGGAQDMVVVSEPGVYRLVFSSRRPEAERFKRWLAHEVIPSIRKTGSFSTIGDTQEAIVAAAPLEHRPFPDWPLEEARWKSSTIRDYRTTYGIGAAQWIMPRLGYPVPPPELIENGRQLSMIFAFQENGGAV